MDPRLRFWLVVFVATVLSIAAGFAIAQESYAFATLVSVGLLWVFIEWQFDAWPEIWVLALVCFGYIVGNRGFAQLSLTARLPLLPAECAGLVGVPALLFRTALHRARPFRRDALNLVLLGWIALGAARLPLDLHHWGALALRDFAMVYYAAFFFVGQALTDHARSLRQLRRTLTAAYLVLPLLALAVARWPDAFLQYSTIRGTPLIFHKPDLIAASLAAGFFWFWARWEQSRKRIWLLAAALPLPVIAAMASPRAAMVATGMVTAFWLVARRWRLLAFQGLVAICAVLALVPFLLFSKESFRQSAVYSVYEHAISIADVSGQGVYLHAESGDPGDNNRFRLVWWHAVADETMENHPVFGLGFGYDLAARFLADYDWLTNEDFSARSPHSMIMSVFGRMGAVGLLLWLGIAGIMAQHTWRAFMAHEFEAMAWWSVVWVIWVSACFGVVLEGPMGAVVFWTVLGVANASAADRAAAEADDTADEHLPTGASAHELAAS